MFKEEHKIPYTLLSDEKGEVAKAFGVPVNKGGAITYKGQSLVRGVSISRWTAVIDKAGNLAAIDPVKDAGGDAKRIAELVQKLSK